MARSRKEIVSVSFHYFCRLIKNGNGDPKFVPFSSEEFENLFRSIKSRPTIDLSDKEAVERLRFRADVPLEKTTRVDERIISGVFKASYSGHAYDNTARGRIPADSVSLRPFHYMLYLSESGRIYVASQYLGQFGGYSALQSTIRPLFKSPETIASRSFNLGNLHYKDAIAKEVRVSFSDRSHSIAAGNSFTKSGMIAFKKTNKDDGFEGDVSRRLFGFFGRPADEVKKGIAELLSESSLLEVGDDDIEDCTIVASVNGRRKTIHLLDSGGFASRFPIDVPLNADGHPRPEPTKKAMLDLLKKEIIARKENV